MFFHVRDAGAFGILQLVEARDIGDEHLAVPRQDAGAEAVQGVVEAAREDRAFISAAAAGGVFQPPNLIRIRGEVAGAAGEFVLPLAVDFRAVVERLDLQIVFEEEPEIEGGIAAVLGSAFAEAVFLGRVDPPLFINADGHGAGELGLRGPKLDSHPLGRFQLGYSLRRGLGAIGEILLGVGLRWRGDQSEGTERNQKGDQTKSHRNGPAGWGELDLAMIPDAAPRIKGARPEQGPFDSGNDFGAERPTPPRNHFQYRVEPMRTNALRSISTGATPAETILNSRRCPGEPPHLAVPSWLARSVRRFASAARPG